MDAQDAILFLCNLTHFLGTGVLKQHFFSESGAVEQKLGPLSGALLDCLMSAEQLDIRPFTCVEKADVANYKAPRQAQARAQSREGRGPQWPGLLCGKGLASV